LYVVAVPHVGATCSTSLPFVWVQPCAVKVPFERKTIFQICFDVSFR
jgi:hypothetical protein